MSRKNLPLFIYADDFKRLLKKSDKTVYNEMSKVRQHCNLRPNALITIYHFSKYYNTPIEHVLERLV